MPNPSPVQSDQFKAQQFKPVSEIPDDVKLAKTATSVKLPEPEHEALWKLPKKERIEFTRRILCEGIRKELMSDE